MAFNVNDFRGQLAFGGARSSLFRVTLQIPAGDGDASAKSQFMVQSAEIPAASLGTVTVPYFGRTVKLAGNRTFAPWTVTVLNDEDFKIRNALEAWSHKINTFVTNIGFQSPSSYKSQAIVEQFSKAGDMIRRYKFDGMWCVDVSAIGLDWATDGVQTFTTTFEYDWWTVDDAGTTGVSTNEVPA